MKGITVRMCGGPEVLEYRELDEVTAGTGELIIKICAAGVNPVDTYIRSGSQGRTPSLPYTPGSDGAGIVALVGSGVAAFTPGDRVYCQGSLSGTYAEKCRCRADQVHHLPDSLSFAQGASIGIPYCTAYRALLQVGSGRKGERVLVHGASGGVGTAAVQLARRAGLEIFATAGSAQMLEMLEELGADRCFDHYDTDHFTQLAEAAGEHGIDLILEFASEKNLGKDLPLLAKRGRVVVVGSRAEVTITPRDLMKTGGEILGMMLFSASPEEMAQINESLTAGFAAGALSPVVGASFSLEAAAEAHRQIIEGPAKGNIVLEI